jgi:hypothetical protein
MIDALYSTQIADTVHEVIKSTPLIDKLLVSCMYKHEW